MNTILNISAYKFVPLPDAPALREPLQERALALGLKGTILLAEEGINLFLAGPAEAVRGFVAELHADPRFADITPKESWSDRQPFRKMLVKVKREIIRMNHPTIRPAEGRAPAVPAATVKRWLDQGHDDEGRPVVTLDTRNDFEVDHGTFEGAIDWRITKFTEFPQARAGAQGRAGRQDRGELLHRRHPLRKGRHPHAAKRAGPCLPARRRHPQVLRGNRRRPLPAATASCSTSARPWTPICRARRG